MFKFDTIPKYCINLPYRADRKQDMISQFENHKLDVTFVEAIDKNHVVIPCEYTKKHEYNASAILACAASHVKVINMALGFHHEKYVLILEDDCIFSDDFQERIKFIESLHLKFDMFYLGGHYDSCDDMKQTRYPHIFRMKNVAGTYAYILKKTVFDYIRKNYHYLYGWDEFLATFVQPNFVCLGYLPFLVGHKPGLSDVALHYCDYKGVNDHFQKEKI